MLSYHRESINPAATTTSKLSLHTALTLLTVLEYPLSPLSLHTPPWLLIQFTYSHLHCIICPSILVLLLLRPPPRKEEENNNNKNRDSNLHSPVPRGLATILEHFFSSPSLHLHVGFTELHAYRLFLRNFQAPFIRWSSIRFPR